MFLISKIFQTPRIGAVGRTVSWNNQITGLSLQYMSSGPAEYEYQVLT